jgi:cell division GTPase FtsZ
MENTFIKKSEIQKAVLKVSRIQSAISIDESDFGNIKNIKAYQVFILKNETDRFDYEINESLIKDTTKLIVYTAGNNIKLKTIEYILISIRNRFNKDVEIIYGTSNNTDDEQITIHIFLLN